MDCSILVFHNSNGLLCDRWLPVIIYRWRLLAKYLTLCPQMKHSIVLYIFDESLCSGTRINSFFYDARSIFQNYASSNFSKISMRSTCIVFVMKRFPMFFYALNGFWIESSFYQVWSNERKIRIYGCSICTPSIFAKRNIAIASKSEFPHISGLGNLFLVMEIYAVLFESIVHVFVPCDVVEHYFQQLVCLGHVGSFALGMAFYFLGRIGSLPGQTSTPPQTPTPHESEQLRPNQAEVKTPFRKFYFVRIFRLFDKCVFQV